MIKDYRLSFVEIYDHNRIVKLTVFHLRSLGVALTLAPLFAIAVSTLPAANPSSADAPTEPVVEPPPPATDATAKKILENFITVLGGADALRKVALIQATGTETPVGKGDIVKFTYWIAPPNRARLDTVVSLNYGKTREIHQYVDGKNGWSIETTAKAPVAQDTALPNLTRLADFIYPFLDYDARSLRFEYSGKEKSRGMDALVVKFWPAAGSPPESLFFDPTRFLLLRIRQQTKVGGHLVFSNIFVTKYDKINGLWMPTAWEYALGDAVFARAEANIKFLPQVDPALFAHPATKKMILGVPESSPAN